MAGQWMRLRAETFTLLSLITLLDALNSSICTEEQCEGRDGDKECHISYFQLGTNVETWRDENFGLFPGKGKEKWVPSLGLLEQLETTISGLNKKFN